MELKYIILIVAVVFLLLVVLGLAIVNYSTEDMVDKFKDASRFSVGTTPIELANNLNSLFFKNSIKIKFKDKMFCDSFNGTGILTLSSHYANKYELAGLAICAHEFGHAFQFKEKPKMMRSHAKKTMLSKAISWLISPLLIAGIIMLLLSELNLAIILGAMSLSVFLIAIITKISTLKIEKDASKRAMEILEVYASLSDEQLIIAKKFLNSAKQTYLAELLRIMLKWTFLVKKR